MTTALALDRVTVSHGQIVAVRDLSLNVPTGSLLAIVGPNGAGKSSLVEAVAGRADYAGIISAFGDELQGTAAQRTRRGVGLVPQDRELFYGLTVNENLVVGCAGLDRRTTKAAIDSSYETFPVLAKLRDRRAGFLSGGERQILAIARVFARHPRLVLLDEPSLGLSPSMRLEITDRVLQLCRERDVTAVVTEQFLEMVLGKADRLLVLVKGAVVWDGRGTNEDWDEISRLYLASGDEPSTTEPPAYGAIVTTSDEQRTRGSNR
jgi:ABC-type branched-subunit amino acid transport system ATPase component